MKTSELKGAALDWAVAKCEGYFDKTLIAPFHFLSMRKAKGHGVHWTHSSTDWGEGGPIIEREKIQAQWETTDVGDINSGYWVATHCLEQGKYFQEQGATPLEAAMRCYVASKLGDEVEIPEELI